MKMGTKKDGNVDMKMGNNTDGKHENGYKKQMVT
jgi:hypothetical protein